MFNFITKDRLLTVLAVIIVLAVLALGWLNWQQDEQIRREAWENSFPMANQCIEWSGAGYLQTGE